jgi:uncharacterized protein (TIRG00374 family)
VTERPARRRSAFLDWKAVVGVLISAGFLWYAFRDVDLGEVWHQIRAANPILLLLSGAIVTLPFPLRALRWRPLLEPVYPGTRFRPRYAATCIGFMTNNVVPARVGEFARAYALTRMEPIRMSASFGSLVVERMFDGILVVGLLFVSMATPGFPQVSGRDFGSIGVWLGLLFLVGFAALLAMVVRPERSVRLFERTVARVIPSAVRRPVVDALEAFLDGVAALRDWRLVGRAFAWSVVIWLTVAFGTWVGFRAFDIDVPFVGAIFLQSVLALAVALPSAPGYFGVFEAAARVGLVEVWGVESSRALAFALGFHMAGFIPVTLIGFYYLWRVGLSWREVETSEERVETAVEAGMDERAARPGPT